MSEAVDILKKCNTEIDYISILYIFYFELKFVYILEICQRLINSYSECIDLLEGCIKLEPNYVFDDKAILRQARTK